MVRNSGTTMNVGGAPRAAIFAACWARLLPCTAGGTGGRTLPSPPSRMGAVAAPGALPAFGWSLAGNCWALSGVPKARSKDAPATGKGPGPGIGREGRLVRQQFIDVCDKKPVPIPLDKKPVPIPLNQLISSRLSQLRPQFRGRLSDPRSPGLMQFRSPTRDPGVIDPERRTLRASPASLRELFDPAPAGVPRARRGSRRAFCYGWPPGS